MNVSQVLLKKALFFATTGLLISQLSCSGEAGTDGVADSSMADSTSTTVVLDDEETDDMLPSPLQVAAIFRSSGLKFLPGLTNSADNAGNYSSTISRALNMGVYSADLAYCILNKQTNDGQSYLKVNRTLAEQINLGKVFSQTNLYDRFNQNLGNEDSMQTIIADLKMETDGLLEQNEQKHLYGVIFAGAWIESLHIAGQVYKKEDNSQVMLKLFEQMVVLDKLVSVLDANAAQDPAIATLSTDLKGLRDVFNGLPSVKKLNADSNLELLDVKPTREELVPLIDKISEIRNKLVSKG